jgi:hypothetical protein
VDAPPAISARTVRDTGTTTDTASSTAVSQLCSAVRATPMQRTVRMHPDSLRVNHANFTETTRCATTAATRRGCARFAVHPQPEQARRDAIECDELHGTCV